MRALMKILLYILFSLYLIQAALATPTDDLTTALKTLKAQKYLKGLQLQITKNQSILYNLNLGQKNEANDPIDNNTIFRLASVSKSFTAVAIMQLVEQGKLSLKQTLTSILGYPVQNPNYPQVEITVEMILTHQSGVIQCDPYYSNFLSATYVARTGYQVPSLKEILVKGGKYYNDCHYSKKYRPGTRYQYGNLNYGIAGTIVQVISRERFDWYHREHILIPLSEGLQDVATFNPASIEHPINLGVCYKAENETWVPSVDNYPSGLIPQRNLTGYKIGDNGIIYGPQGGLRMSATHLSQYAIMLANGGKTRLGKTIISQESLNKILRPHYQFSGVNGGSPKDYHLYGYGIYTTTYRTSDVVINHQVVRGHTGGAYNLISAHHFWRDYTLTYIISGALYGYKFGNITIYEQERDAIHSAVQRFVTSRSQALY